MSSNIDAVIRRWRASMARAPEVVARQVSADGGLTPAEMVEIAINVYGVARWEQRCSIGGDWHGRPISRDDLDAIWESGRAVIGPYATGKLMASGKRIPRINDFRRRLLLQHFNRLADGKAPTYPEGTFPDNR